MYLHYTPDFDESLQNKCYLYHTVYDFNTQKPVCQLIHRLFCVENDGFWAKKRKDVLLFSLPKAFRRQNFQKASIYAASRVFGNEGTYFITLS